MARALTLMPQRPESGGSDDVTRDNSLDFGAAELAGFPNLQLGVALQVGTRWRVERHCRQAIAVWQLVLCTNLSAGWAATAWHVL